jgi:stage V sporulation protein G
VQLDVRVYPLADPIGSTKAFASVGVEDMVAIRGIRIVEGEKGAFVSMPQSKDKDGGYHDIAFPMNGELRKEMNKAILSEYKSLDMGHDRGKRSLEEGLKQGAEKAAAHSAQPRATAAKSRGGSMLD